MRRSYLIFLMLIVPLSVRGEKVVVFPDLIQPSGLYIAGGEIYVVDGRAGVNVHDLKGGFLRTISRRGEGPGEFRRTPHLRILSDPVFFGVFEKIKEKRFYPLGKAMPVGKNYVSISNERQGEDLYRTIKLRDGEMKIIKEQFRSVRPQFTNGVNPVGYYLGFETHDEKIYIAEGHEDL